MIEQHDIVDDSRSFDEQSLTLNLSRNVVRIQGNAESEPITYGTDLGSNRIVEERLSEEGLLLAPGDCVLACSRQKVNIPVGYFGLVQTKGSLARLFVAVQVSDGQIEGGFCGSVTFEIVNLAKFPILLPIDSPVAQLYVWKTTTRNYKAYQGRYAESDKPTISKALH